jgi:hypothetical protein
MRVGEMAEEQRAQAGAGDVDGGRRADLALRQPDARAVLGEAAGDRADDRDLEAVEDPHRAQADDDQPVPPGPRQPVHPGRDVRLDGAKLDRSGRHADPPLCQSSPRASSSPGASSGKRPGTGCGVFFFFSNRLGCFGSLLVSAVLTLILLVILGVL